LGSTPTLPSSWGSKEDLLDNDLLPLIDAEQSVFENLPGFSPDMQENFSESDSVNSLDLSVSEGVGSESVQFSLSLFPSVFHSGPGAEQLTNIYQYIAAASTGATMDQLTAAFPSYDAQCLQLMLDMLSRKRLLSFSKGTGKWSRNK
jgi:hypothetical protein